MHEFHYVYVLRSLLDGEFYTGYTNDLRRRLVEHKSGQVRSTKARLPVELVYYEACQSQADATKREKYLKTAWGKRYLNRRLEDYLTG
jgi:putative endonuclease